MTSSPVLHPESRRAQGRAVESICRVLREQGCKIAARAYRSWFTRAVAPGTITDAQVVDAVRAVAWERPGDGLRTLAAEALYGPGKNGGSFAAHQYGAGEFWGSGPRDADFGSGRGAPRQKYPHDRIDKSGTVTLRTHGKLRHIGIGRTHAGTHVILLIQDLNVRVINAITGEILRELTIDLTKDHQGRGTKTKDT